MKRFGLALLLLAFVAPASAETIPPGDYSDTGRVVRTARGSIELFGGHGCLLLLNERLQAELVGYVGEFVRVDYTRAEAADVVPDRSGAAIVKIRKVTSLARNHSGWCDRPRICDITAAWLAGYTADKMKFPQGGSLDERDAGVATIVKTLRENPTRFSILK